MLNFIIPIRHYENIRDVDIHKRFLKETLKSLSNQTHCDTRIILVVNRGTNLPSLPKNAEVCFVDFPPNIHHDRDGQSDQLFYDNVHFDIARRVFSGLALVKPNEYFMKVDDDDLVHKDISLFCAQKHDVDGFTIDKGYMWSEGSGLLFYLKNFNQLCGSCNIFKLGSLHLPKQFNEASHSYIVNTIGYHNRFHEAIEKHNLNIERVTFPAAIYRIGHGNSHSGYPNFWRLYFRGRELHKKPFEFFNKLMSLRVLTKRKKNMFFG